MSLKMELSFSLSLDQIERFRMSSGSSWRSCSFEDALLYRPSIDCLVEGTPTMKVVATTWRWHVLGLNEFYGNASMLEWEKREEAKAEISTRLSVVFCWDLRFSTSDVEGVLWHHFSSVFKASPNWGGKCLFRVWSLAMNCNVWFL